MNSRQERIKAAKKQRRRAHAVEAGIGCGVVFYVLLWAAFWVGVFAVAIHFILKYW